MHSTEMMAATMFAAGRGDHMDLAPLHESVEQRHCSRVPLLKHRRSWFLWSKYTSTSSHCFVEHPLVVT